MTRKKLDENEKTRIQVVASRKQAEILDDAAKAAGASDRSVWILAHALKAAHAQDANSAPLVISGELADKLRSEAARQGVNAEQVLQQFLLTAGA